MNEFDKIFGRARHNKPQSNPDPILTSHLPVFDEQNFRLALDQAGIKTFEECCHNYRAQNEYDNVGDMLEYAEVVIGTKRAAIGCHDVLYVGQIFVGDLRMGYLHTPEPNPDADVDEMAYWIEKHIMPVITQAFDETLLDPLGLNRRRRSSAP